MTQLDEDALLLSVPQPVSSVRDRLTTAELSVARLALHGLANEAIAIARGSSVRTVVNQLSAVYSKLGISGRRELSAFLHGLE